MVYKLLIKIILLIFFSVNSFSNILYNKKGIVVTDIELNIYKDIYFEYHNTLISGSESLKDLVLIKNVIRDLKENNSDFINQIDNQIINQFGKDIIENEIILNFYRFAKIRDEFIYNYFRNKLKVNEIESIFKSLNELNLPISENNCLLIKEVINLKENNYFINNFFNNLKNNLQDYKVEINGIIYDVCIDKTTYYEIEKLIVNYIRVQTDKEFKYFVYAKSKN